jgi:hypothetical protein
MDAHLSIMASPTIAVRRCRDGRQIERILREDYYEQPICYFPGYLKRWVAHEIEGRQAGVAFGHTLGPTY